MGHSLRKISFTFPRPLDQLVAYNGEKVLQEEIFVSNIAAVQERVVKELNKILKGMKLIHLDKLMFFAPIRIQIEGMSISLQNFMALEKSQDGRTYDFYYPLNMSALMDLTEMAKKVPIIGKSLGNRDMRIAKVVREKQFIEAMQRFVFKDMGVPTEEVLITATDVDAVELHVPRPEIETPTETTPESFSDNPLSPPPETTTSSVEKGPATEEGVDQNDK